MRTQTKVKTMGQGYIFFIIATAILLTFLGAKLLAMPPYPDIQKKIDAGEVAKPFVSQALKISPQAQAFNTASKLNVAQITGTFKALCILVDFSDHVSQTSASFYDTLIFAKQPGTVNDYYREASYAQIDIVSVSLPSSLGWQRAPNTYAYYVDSNYATDSPYPHNSQKLCEDLVDLVDPIVDFSQYDNDGNGTVDVVMIVHSGPGAEFTGSRNDIWSHKWGINPRLKDNVYVGPYTIMPEYWSSSGDMTIGVYCHELGHVFGLPDLYDTDYSSKGVGNYSLMSSGSWNGSLGSSPAHLDAWCKMKLGWVTPTVVTENQTNVSIPNVENNATIYKLWTNGTSGDEYFLVENRQKIGYDSYLPGAGLCIWHIDDGVSDNTHEWYPGYTAYGHLLVALEQADNLFQLEKNSSNGDAGDFFPGTTNNTSFTSSSSPNSNSYGGTNSLVEITNISASASTMTADFAVSLAAAADDNNGAIPDTREVVLEQNFPNPFNPSTTIQYTLSSASDVELRIYNMLGEKVAIIDNGFHTAGTYTASWDGTTSSGSASPSGIYLYELVTDQAQEVRKMLLMK